MRVFPFFLALLALSLATVQAAPAGPDGGRELLKPPALAPGDTIAFVAPAKWRATEPTRIARERLESMGYKVVTIGETDQKFKYLAGTDEDRAAWLMEALTNPEVDAVFPVTGGYGTQRILDRLDYEAIRANPKVVIGSSDLTALHLAMLRRAGVVSFHSPYPTYMYIGDSDKSYPHEQFWNALAERPYLRRRALDPEARGFAIDTETPSTPVTTIAPGKARGRLTGGNLTLVSTLMGTPYEIQAQGALLFFEDIGEDPYRIDRMLKQLELAGKLDECAGVILGHWRGCETDNPEGSFTLREVFDQYFAGRPYPVVYQFPVGHVVPNATLPMGVLAELDAEAGTLRILEDPVLVE